LRQKRWKRADDAREVAMKPRDDPWWRRPVAKTRRVEGGIKAQPLHHGETQCIGQRELLVGVAADDRAGLALVAVTGRPAGWGRVLARQWPVAGCIAENGAVAVVLEVQGDALLAAIERLEVR